MIVLYIKSNNYKPSPMQTLVRLARGGKFKYLQNIMQIIGKIFGIQS